MNLKPSSGVRRLLLLFDDLEEGTERIWKSNLPLFFFLPLRFLLPRLIASIFACVLSSPYFDANLNWNFQVLMKKFWRKITFSYIKKAFFSFASSLKKFRASSNVDKDKISGTTFEVSFDERKVKMREDNTWSWLLGPPPPPHPQPLRSRSCNHRGMSSQLFESFFTYFENACFARTFPPSDISLPWLNPF